MQSKEEINKKKGKVSEQLDLVDVVTAGDKIRKKRMLIFLFLFLTIGVSLSFWAYREIKNNSFHLSLPRFNLKLFFPSIIPKPDPTSSIISADPNSWNLCFYDLVSSSLLFSKNCYLSAPPTALPQNPPSLLKSLPSGLTIKESLLTSDQTFEFQALITSPVHQFLLIAKVFGSSSLSDSQKLLPAIADALYWRFSSP